MRISRTIRSVNLCGTHQLVSTRMSEGYCRNLPFMVEQDASTPVASKRVATRCATFGDENASTRVQPRKRARRSYAAGTYLTEAGNK